MKAALVLVFFVCISGSMASDVSLQTSDQTFQQGQDIIEMVVNHLKQQISDLSQNAFSQLLLVGGLIDNQFNSNLVQIMTNFKSTLDQFINQALTQLYNNLVDFITG